MNIEYPGLLKERLPSGRYRYRVRVDGDPKTKIRIYAEPGHEDFHRQYLAARTGERQKPVKRASEYATPRSLGWLVASYLEHLERAVEAGTMSHKTLKKKRNLLAPLMRHTDVHMFVSRGKWQRWQDERSATPAQADAFIMAARGMYNWALKREYVRENPVVGIEKIYRDGPGAQPWKADDVRKFYARHKLGSKPHVAMTVLLWTGCRIEDLIILGREHECVLDGVEALRWTPLKKGSTEVTVPIFPPLKDATRAPTVQGRTYVLGQGGNPYSSGDSMSAMFKRWCKDADLGHLSAHGVRKGLAELLAELGCSQYGIMSILGHSEAKTSEVYTRRVERWRLALDGLGKVANSGVWWYK
ncbi:tyrosine-type recombinase/integrase [Oricola thermophila]|nr:tyrosine-type recombinase/integrase [Oricola thermophila]